MLSFVFFPSSVLLNFSLKGVFSEKVFSIIANLRSARTDAAALPIPIKVSCPGISLY